MKNKKECFLKSHLNSTLRFFYSRYQMLFRRKGEIKSLIYYKNQKKNGEEFLPMTEKISNTILTIPLYPNMTIEEKDYLTNSILEFFEDIIN